MYNISVGWGCFNILGGRCRNWVEPEWQQEASQRRSIIIIMSFKSVKASKDVIGDIFHTRRLLFINRVSKNIYRSVVLDLFKQYSR